MLYDIIIKVLNGAVENIVQQRYDAANKQIYRAQNVLSELMAYLNIEEGGEISISLCRLYKYFKTQLREAGRSHDKEKIKHMIKQTKELRSVWHEIAKVANKNQHMNGIAKQALSYTA
jgi:flagellar protein FliS